MRYLLTVLLVIISLAATPAFAETIYDHRLLDPLNRHVVILPTKIFWVELSDEEPTCDELQLWKGTVSRITPDGKLTLAEYAWLEFLIDPAHDQLNLPLGKKTEIWGTKNNGRIHVRLIKGWTDWK